MDKEQEQISEISSAIWSCAELLRGSMTSSSYISILASFMILRRLEFRSGNANWKSRDTQRGAQTLERVRTSVRPERDLINLVNSVPQSLRDIFESFGFFGAIERLNQARILRPLVERFALLDLSPSVVSGNAMGAVFETILTRITAQSNYAFEHYTAQDAASLVVDLLLADVSRIERGSKQSRVYDPTAGSGGMLYAAGKRLITHSAQPPLLYGQEINSEAYAMCKARLFLSDQSGHIALGNTLTEDAYPSSKFDFMVCNPPYGVSWKYQQPIIEAERRLGMAGRFPYGLPRTSDSQMLFMMHLMSKMHPDRASKIAIITNAGPLSWGDTGSGESEIRRHILANDLLDAVVALPTGLYFNTSIPTYVWIITNRKPESRKGAVQLIDAGGLFHRMRESIGSKTQQVTPEQSAQAVAIYLENRNLEHSKIVENSVFLHGARDRSSAGGSRVYTGVRFEYIFLEDELERLAERTDQQIYPLPEVTDSIVVADNDKEQEGGLNAVYLPVLGTGKALTSLEDATAAKYLRVLFKDELAESRYVAAFYNSALGRKLRKALSTGVVPRISASALTESSIVLPPHNIQLSCVEVDTAIENLISELSTVRADVWGSPMAIHKTEKRLPSVNKANSLLAWIDTLPYPLASILALYNAAGDDDRARYEALLSFFEALAEFLATVFLSALTPSMAHSAHAEFPIGHKAPLRSPLRSSTFGSWVEIVSRMRKFAASLQAGSPEANIVLTQALGTTNPVILEMLLSETVVSASREAKDIRNKIKAHGGLVTDAVAKSAHTTLQALLADVRAQYAETWGSYGLYQAGSCDHEREIRQHARWIMGRSPAFEQRTVTVNEPVRKGRLFLLDLDENRPVTLLPLITLGSSPESADNAVYFYNRQEKGEIEFVSYHFAPQPHIVERSPELREEFNALFDLTDARKKNKYPTV